MTRQLWPQAAALGILSMLVCAPAFAQLGGDGAGAFPAERLRPGMDREAIIDVESGRVGAHLEMDAALWLNYALNPLVVYKRENNELSRLGSLVGHRFGANLVGSVALLDWVKLGFDLPITLLQLGDQSIPGLPPQTLAVAGLGDFRFSPKIRLLRAEDAFVDVAVIPTLTIPTGFPLRSYLGDGFLTFVPEVAVSRSLDGISVAANLAYRARPTASIANLSVGHEFVYRAGLGFDLATVVPDLPLRLNTSLSGAVGTYPFVKSLGQLPLESLSTANYGLGPDIELFGGFGVGLVGGFGTPTFRLLAGARWAPRSVDADSDGIDDADDRCPKQPEDRDQFEDADGCPDLDNDNDGILDTEDKCPQKAEDTDGFEDEDGCPDPDNDQDGVPDDVDKCPIEAGEAERDGCPIPDADQDGIEDGADYCPQKPEDKDGFEDEDGCPDLDNDGDLVPDEKDTCPMVPGKAVYDGCLAPDRDGDGVDDDADQCPDEAEDQDNFKDEDGCPDLDNDDDGVLDDADQCPTEGEDKDGFEDEDGCPDLDNDKDGIPDTKDKCPLEPETINGVKDKDGCPDKGKSKVVVTREKIEILEKVFFATGRATIRTRSFNLLGQVGSVLKAHPEITKLRIEGHTDSQGRASSNKRLSERRANAVREFLKSQGIDAKRLVAVGFGEEKPIDTNATAAGREANRRVEFTVIEIDGKPIESSQAIRSTETETVESDSQ